MASIELFKVKAVFSCPRRVYLPCKVLESGSWKLQKAYSSVLGKPISNTFNKRVNEFRLQNDLSHVINPYMKPEEDDPIKATLMAYTPRQWDIVFNLIEADVVTNRPDLKKDPTYRAYVLLPSHLLKSDSLIPVLKVAAKMISESVIVLPTDLV